MTRKFISKVGDYAGCAALLCAALGCGAQQSPPAPPAPNPAAPPKVFAEPPAIDLADLDPPVRQAIEAAQASIRAQPQSAAAWGQLGKLLLAHELAYDAALECLSQAEQRAPQEPQWSYLAGVWLATRDPGAAIAKFERAVAIGGPEEMTFRQRLAETLIVEGRYDDAERQLKRILKRSELNAAAWLALGRAYLQQAQLADARTAFDRAQSDPRAKKRALQLSAQAWQRLGNPKEARRLDQLAAQAQEGGAWPDLYVDEVTRLRQGRRNELAEADLLLALGRPQDAIAVLKRTLQRYPDLGWAWLLLGRAYLQRNDPEQAAAALQQSLARLPEAPEAHFYLGAARLQQQKFQDAAAAFRRATEITPDFAVAHFQLAQCLVKLGEEQSALTSLQRAIQAKPDLAAAHLLLARLHHQRRERDAALRHAQAAVQLLPSDPAAKRMLESIQGEPPVDGP